jgi:hypothetical protein
MSTVALGAPWRVAGPAFRRARDAVDRFFFVPSPPAPLALLRIALGVMMMMEAFGVRGSLDDLYGPLGFLQADLMGSVSATTLPYYYRWVESFGLSYSECLHILFGVRWLFLLGFTFGLGTRLCTGVLWVMQGALVYSGLLSSYGVDRYFHVLLFLLLFLPAGEALSLDNVVLLRRPRPSAYATFGLRVVQLALLITYLDAGLSKAAGHEWWNGEAIWRVLNLPDFRQAYFFWLADWPMVPKLLGWGTLLFETFYFAGVWLPYVGVAWTLAIIAMHLGIAAFMGLGIFGVSLALVNACVFLVPRLRGFKRFRLVAFPRLR